MTVFLSIVADPCCLKQFVAAAAELRVVPIQIRGHPKQPRAGLFGIGDGRHAIETQIEILDQVRSDLRTSEVAGKKIGAAPLARR